ncbi:hypothetical protein VCRA2126O85_230031 [Vibrio crassostreae]|nr:hypothetical protein VCRA2125O83_210030 [Vibrio crassostreae]CAK2758770.1 hypothetical protein VCRA2128O106_210056 [Vibrio crassostreae]CAK2761315.1 hypothetical protein VCRA2128O100_230054 [Vibrio crassostreae]CAK2763573.1 hypothetical protein VCRA2127O91_230030 [Vibrio crassostreae]CAK2768779.1 hypothetical protein VCRA2126O85_230031 [Vibrio crassostreae]
MSFSKIIIIFIIVSILLCFFTFKTISNMSFFIENLPTIQEANYFPYKNTLSSLLGTIK